MTASAVVAVVVVMKLFGYGLVIVVAQAKEPALALCYGVILVAETTHSGILAGMWFWARRSPPSAEAGSQPSQRGEEPESQS